jgi:hypothetical protein
MFGMGAPGLAFETWELYARAGQAKLENSNREKAPGPDIGR